MRSKAAYDTLTIRSPSHADTGTRHRITRVDPLDQAIVTPLSQPFCQWCHRDGRAIAATGSMLPRLFRHRWSVTRMLTDGADVRQYPDDESLKAVECQWTTVMNSTTCTSARGTCPPLDGGSSPRW
jgi:molybdenum cofactor biosynthesis enzyme MoaA